jgi:hypothetical protein
MQVSFKQQTWLGLLEWLLWDLASSTMLSPQALSEDPWQLFLGFCLCYIMPTAAVFAWEKWQAWISGEQLVETEQQEDTTEQPAVSSSSGAGESSEVAPAAASAPGLAVGGLDNSASGIGPAERGHAAAPEKSPEPLPFHYTSPLQRRHLVLKVC